MSICLSSILSLSNDVSDPLPVQRVVYLLSIRLNVICPCLCLCSVVLSRRSLSSHYSATSVFVTLLSSDTIRHLPIHYSRCCFSPAFRYWTAIQPTPSLAVSFRLCLFGLLSVSSCSCHLLSRHHRWSSGVCMCL